MNEYGAAGLLTGGSIARIPPVSGARVLAGGIYLTIPPVRKPAALFRAHSHWRRAIRIGTSHQDIA
jgi:hypothetical protein